ncbi:MAG: hypothetical protein ACE5HW_00815 [Candidatus Methanofastidiosia archaeon]
MKLRTKIIGLSAMAFLMVLLLFILHIKDSDSNEFRIIANPYKQWNPAIYENIVVWVEERNNNEDIHGYELSAIPPSITSPPPFYYVWLVLESIIGILFVIAIIMMGVKIFHRKKSKQ